MQNFKLCLLGLAGFGIAVTFSHELRADDCPNGTANGCVDYTKPKPLKKGPCARVEVINEGRCTLFVTSPKAECNKTSLRYLVLNNDYPYRRGKVHVRQGDSVNLRCFSKKKQIKNI